MKLEIASKNSILREFHIQTQLRLDIETHYWEAIKHDEFKDT